MWYVGNGDNNFRLSTIDCQFCILMVNGHGTILEFEFWKVWISFATFADPLDFHSCGDEIYYKKRLPIIIQDSLITSSRLILFN